MSRRQTRVLWLPYGQRGSLYPVVPVIEQIVARDAEVVLLGLHSLAPLAKRLGVRFLPYRSGIEYDWSRADTVDGHSQASKAGGWFAERLMAECREVELALTDVRPDVVLTDSFVVGGGLTAERHGIPWASYVHYLFDESASVDAMYQIEWWLSDRSELDAYLDWWNAMRRMTGLGPERRDVEEAPWYRMSPWATFLLGHPMIRRGSRPLPKYVWRTSVRPWDESNVPSESHPKLAGPHVLVSNSSAWQDDIALVEATSDGLATLSGQVLATVAAEHAVTSTPPANVTITRYLPHTLLLPQVDAVVSTAGYGTVSKALWYGRPLVLAPHARDQHYVAEAAASVGAAIVAGSPPTAAAVRSAVDHVLHSAEVRDVAAALSGRRTDYLDETEVAEQVTTLAEAG